MNEREAGPTVGSVPSQRSGRVTETPDDDEITLSGGEVNTVVRVGATVRRLPGPWTPAIHGVLRHLESVGFDGAPRVHGFDHRGREILTFIPGVAATRPWPPALRTDDGLGALVRMLRSYHTSISTYRPPRGTRWALGVRAVGSSEVIRHGDFGPWNTIWADGRLQAIIDWDMAEPGDPILDLAQAALFAVPLQGDEGWRLAGFDHAPDLRHRLRLVCETYGDNTVSALLRALHNLCDLEIDRVDTLGVAGVTPWNLFRQRGRVDEYLSYRSWLGTNAASLR